MLRLSKRQVDELVEHSKREAPNEACGILAGQAKQSLQPSGGGPSDRRERKVEKIYPMTNTDRSAVKFFMDPKEQLRVMKEIRNSGLEMVGIYHSHPDTAAYPSAHDVELAFYTEASYAIVSIKDKDRPEIRSFSIVDGKIKEEEVETIGD